MVGAAKKTLGWYFILADFEEISVIILAFIVYGQHNSRFDEFCWNLTKKQTEIYRIFLKQNASPLFIL